MKTKTPAAVAYPMTVIKLSLAVCFALRIPAYIWGGVGVGKTSMIKQLAEEMGAWLYMLYLSTMEPTDVGGHPYPQERNDRMILDFIQAEGMLPFVTPERPDQNAIVLADEVDRSLVQTQNPFMNLMRERQLNGRKIVANAAFVCTGNGVTDSGTTPISDAMATRGVHFYVETGSAEAFEAWDGWAEKNGMSPWVRGFARYRQKEIVGPQPAFCELQKPNNRTIEDAFRLIEFVNANSWDKRVIEPLVFGSVGQVIGREMIGFRSMFEKTPTAEQIAADPMGAPIPQGSDIFVLWALGRYLLDRAVNGTKGERVDFTAAFAEYVGRWPDETAGDWMRTASTRLPSLVGTKGFKRWESRQNITRV